MNFCAHVREQIEIYREKSLAHPFVHGITNGTLLLSLLENFKRSCYYEWQFWEMFWTFQDWVQEVKKYELPANL